ncbi:MAG: DUF29 domain-containing protein [Cyanobacteria bacterium J06621_12]
MENSKKIVNYDIDQDYDLWLQEQADKLKSHAFADLDLDNLVEELEGLVRGEKSAVESFTYQIIVHLLLIDYWKSESERNRNHWRAEINGFQYQLHNKLSTNLNNYLVDNLDKIYLKARKGAALKTGLGIEVFPDTCPYALEKILGE